MKNEYVQEIVDFLNRGLENDKREFEKDNIDTITAYYNGRIQAIQYALDLIKIWSQVK